MIMNKPHAWRGPPVCVHVQGPAEPAERDPTQVHFFRAGPIRPAAAQGGGRRAGRGPGAVHCRTLGCRAQG